MKIIELYLQYLKESTRFSKELYNRSRVGNLGGVRSLTKKAFQGTNDELPAHGRSALVHSYWTGDAPTLATRSKLFMRRQRDLQNKWEREQPNIQARAKQTAEERMRQTQSNRWRKPFTGDNYNNPKEHSTNPSLRLADTGEKRTLYHAGGESQINKFLKTKQSKGRIFDNPKAGSGMYLSSFSPEENPQYLQRTVNQFEKPAIAQIRTDAGNLVTPGPYRHDLSGEYGLPHDRVQNIPQRDIQIHTKPVEKYLIKPSRSEVEAVTPRAPRIKREDINILDNYLQYLKKYKI